MCLYLNPNSQIRIASRNIVVWKIFDTRSYFEYGLFSPYMGISWRAGETKTERSFTNHNGTPFRSVLRVGKPRQVHRGLHSYNSEPTTYGAVGVRQVIRKCIIPKGTRYISGRCGEIVSLALKLLP
jgi:hypothetical protein